MPTTCCLTHWRLCDSPQALAGEGCALMWALVDLNPGVLASFVNCDIEAAAPRQDLSPGMWRTILVSSNFFPLFLRSFFELAGLTSGGQQPLELFVSPSVLQSEVKAGILCPSHANHRCTVCKRCADC